MEIYVWEFHPVCSTGRWNNLIMEHNRTKWTDFLFLSFPDSAVGVCWMPPSARGYADNESNLSEGTACTRTAPLHHQPQSQSVSLTVWGHDFPFTNKTVMFFCCGWDSAKLKIWGLNMRFPPVISHHTILLNVVDIIVLSGCIFHLFYTPCDVFVTGRQTHSLFTKHMRIIGHTHSRS